MGSSLEFAGDSRYTQSSKSWLYHPQKLLRYRYFGLVILEEQKKQMVEIIEYETGLLRFVTGTLSQKRSLGHRRPNY